MICGMAAVAIYGALSMHGVRSLYMWLSRIKRGYLVGDGISRKGTFKSETRFAPLLILSRRLVSVSADSEKFSAFGGMPSGPACSPVGIVPLWLGPFGERACWCHVGLLVVSGFAGGESFAGEALFD